MERSRTFNTMLLSLGQVLAALAMVLIFAVLSRVLSVRDYGTYMQAMLVYSTALPFMTLGLPQAPFYFLPRNRERASALVYEVLLLLTFMGCVFSIFLLAGGSHLVAGWFGNPDLERALRIIAPYPVFMLPVMSLPACLMVNGRVISITVFSVVAKTTMLVMVAGSCLIWGTLWSALIALVLSSVVVVGPGLRLILQSTSSAIRKPTIAGAWEQLKYSVPLGAAGLIGVLSLKLNQIVVSSICTPEEFAVYVNGAIEIPIVVIVMGSVRSVLLSEFVQMYEKGQKDEIRLLWKRSIVNASAILIPLMVFCEFLAPETIRLLFSAKYEAAVVPFRILLLLLLMRGISLNSVFLATANNKLVLYRGVITLFLNVVLSLILVSWLGYIGASIGLVLAMYLWATPITLIKTAGILDSTVSQVYPFGSVGKILMASLLSSVVLIIKIWAGHWSDILLLGVGALLYFPLVFVMYRALKIPDIPNLKSLISGRGLKRN